MKNREQILGVIKPKDKRRVIDLVARAGFDVSDWANYHGGQERAGANPKYCYEWCFQQEGLYLFNIWFENMHIENGTIFQQLNLRSRPTDFSGVRKVRAMRFDNAIRTAFEIGSHPRVIILDRPAGATSASARMLDPAPWTIVDYDYTSGDFEMRRGIAPILENGSHDPELESFPEGQPRQRFILHRKREAALRKQRIESHMAKHGGRLVCEVPGCGFDFEVKYGDLGKGYAQVHHLFPLSKVGDAGMQFTVNDLAVVCANCHAMIHRGGQCRELDDIMCEIDSNDS